MYTFQRQECTCCECHTGPLSRKGGISLVVQGFFAALILVVLYILSTYNYLIFHSIVEVAGIAVAYAIFIIVWNTRKTISIPSSLSWGYRFFLPGPSTLSTLLPTRAWASFPERRPISRPSSGSLPATSRASPSSSRRSSSDGRFRKTGSTMPA